MTLHDALTTIGAPLRRSAAWRRAAPWAVTALTVIALAAWAGHLSLGSLVLRSSIAWIAGLIGVAGVLIGWRHVGRQFGVHTVADRLEASGHWRSGALSHLLDPLVPGTSPTLHQAALDLQLQQLHDEGEEALASELRETRAGARRLTIATFAAVAFLLLARPLSGRPGALMAPWSLWKALVAPVQLTTSTPEVARGQIAHFDLLAFGHQEAVLQLRSPGEPWHDQLLPLDSEGRARFTTEPLDGDLIARLEAGGRRSPEVRITLRSAATLGALSLRAEYPAYLGTGSELLPVVGDTLMIPEGTRLEFSAKATTPLRLAVAHSPTQPTVPFHVEGSEFVGSIVPQGTSTWELTVVATRGGTLDGLPPPLPIRVIPDQVPTVTIPVPGTDTVASPSRQLTIVVAIEDDHGLASGALEIQKNRGAIVHSPLAIGAATDRALLTSVLDLDALNVVPGDTVRYTATARDHAPGHPPGRSPTYFIVIPTAADTRQERVAATSDVGTAFDSLVRATQDAAQRAEDLSRSRQRGDGDGQSLGNGESMSAETARRAGETAKAAEEIAKRVEEMRRDVAALEQAANRANPTDSTLAEDLGKIRDLLDQALTPELRSAMERLRESLRTLDGDGTQEALRDLAVEQAKLRAALERAKELFERAALETSLATMADEADEIRSAEQKLVAELANGTPQSSAAQSALAERAEQLAKGLEHGAKQASASSTDHALRQTAGAVQNAAEQMRKAAAAAEQGQHEDAAQAGKSAAEMMEPVSQEIRERRESLQQAMREEVLNDLNRLMVETSRVLTRQFAVASALRRGALIGPLRAEEAMLDEATAKLLQQVIVVAGKNALVSPMVGTALSSARDGLRGTLDAISAATPSLGLAADRAGDAVDMLALAAYALLQSERKIEDSESGSGLAEAMEQMMQMAGQQNAAAEKGQSMQQQGGQPGLGEMMQLALQQRAIAQQLERMRAQGMMPGSGELGREAHDLAREIEAGRLSTETTERQRQLFRRMLDAGRSLEGEQDEQSSSRKSETAKSLVVSTPQALDARDLGAADLRLPTWEQLQRLSQDDRRRVLDYFRRLTEGGKP